MSTRLKLNVKNVILGCHNFGEILARHDTSINSGFCRLVKPCPYCRQDNVAVLPRSLDNESLKPITSEIPLISNRLDEVRTTGRISVAAYGLPGESPIRFYYDKKTPKCPPPPPEVHKDCVMPPVPPSPPIATIPKCPMKPKCYPCKPKNPCAKSSPCTLKTFPLHNCRFFSGNPCQPKSPSARPSKPRFCRPKREISKPTPKCRSPAHCGPPPCKKTGPKDPCKPKFGGGGGAGGNECAGVKPAPKECYTTPGKTGGGGPAKKGPICPPK